MLNIKNEDRYIKVLCSLFLFVLVVLAVLGKNFIDYVYHQFYLHHFHQDFFFL